MVKPSEGGQNFPIYQQALDDFSIKGWRFYKLTVEGIGYETPLYSTGDMELLLGRLRYIFQLCQQNLP